MPVATPPKRNIAQWIGLFAGPVLALIVYIFMPETYENADGVAIDFTDAGRATIAVMTLMATWWLTEAIDISATALLPIALFPLFGVAPIKDATAPYGSDIIFLFMGGFLLALSMQRWALDRRIALITLRFVGTRPPMMIAGFMIVTATLSMWVSNTATAAMMLPIALSVIDLVLRQHTGSTLDEHGGIPEAGALGRNFALALMLGIAYAATIGGIATIIGSPPNGIAVDFIKQTYGREISFVQWMMIGLPLSIVFLPIAWALVVYVLFPIQVKRIEGGHAMIQREYDTLGPVSRGEWTTFIVFACTAMLWIFRPLIESISIGGAQPFTGLSDPGIAMIGGLTLFIIPTNVRAGTFAMNWEWARRLPWGILILFGGGLSLAAAVQANGVADFLGAQVATFEGASTLIIVVLVVTVIKFLTELTSNTATAATLIPILAALAPGLGVDPYLLIIPAAISASCAFMMPVATPPNAIIFGSGYVTIPQMCKAGLWLNLIGVVLVTALAFGVVAIVLGMN